MNLTDILYENHGGVAVATFNRPASLNAFRPGTFREFLSVLGEVRADDSVRVLVLTGSGRAFCAGEDLKEAVDLFGPEMQLKPVRDHVLMLQEITRQIVALPKVVISAVNGPAVGFGAEVTIAGDIRLAAEGAYYLFSEVTRSLFETNGVMTLLPRLVGQGRAMEWMMTGARIPASEALAAGLVTHISPPERLMEDALALAHAIAANAPIPVRLVKQVMHRSWGVDLEAVMQMEVDAVLECLTSEDLQEGLKAFAEKRAPHFLGR